MSSIMLFCLRTPQCQMVRNDKTTLCSQLCLFDRNKFLGQIGEYYKNTKCCQLSQNDKTTKCRLLGYIDKCILLGQIGQKDKFTLFRQ